MSCAWISPAISSTIAEPDSQVAVWDVILGAIQVPQTWNIQMKQELNRINDQMTHLLCQKPTSDTRPLFSSASWPISPTLYPRIWISKYHLTPSTYLQPHSYFPCPDDVISGLNIFNSLPNVFPTFTIVSLNVFSQEQDEQRSANFSVAFCPQSWGGFYCSEDRRAKSWRWPWMCPSVSLF